MLRKRMVEILTTKCRTCVEFQRIFDGDVGGGENCPKDTWIPKRKVHAMDDACENYKEYKEGEGNGR